MSRESTIAARLARARVNRMDLPSISLDGGLTLMPEVRVPGRGWRGNRYAVVLTPLGTIGWVSRSASSPNARWGYGAASFFGARGGFRSAEDAARALAQAHLDNQAALREISRLCS